MSDSDDTDNLLLIPPDLFTIHSDAEDAAKPYGPYYRIVDSLITQVSNLETRVNSISTPSSSLDNFTEHIKSTRLMSGTRKYNSLEDLSRELYQRTNQTTPQKSYRLSSLPNTPSTTQYSPIKPKIHVQNEVRSKPSTAQTEMLNEIDTFISNVKTIQKYQTARNLNPQFAAVSKVDSSRDIDRLLDSVEAQKCQKLDESESVCLKENTWAAGDTIESVPDRGMGMREYLYKDTHKGETSDRDPQHFHILTTTGIVPELSTQHSESAYSGNPSLSTDSTQTTAYRTSIGPSAIHANAAHVLNTHKRLLSHNTLHSSLDSRSQNLNSQRSGNSSDFEPVTKNNLALMSLSDLWGGGGDLQHADRYRFINKLQEEKMRRQHCEERIQNLQLKTLELQERLAVAIQVDKAKDEAISQLHKSWEESSSKIDNLCEKNASLEQLVTDLRNKLSQESTEAAQKVGFYEKESSKALTLAHTSHERLLALEKENNVLADQVQSLEKECRELRGSCKLEQENVHDLSRILAEREAELSESKSILADARKEVSQSKKAVEICQTELTSMRLTQRDLERQLNEELERIREIEKEKKAFVSDIEGRKKNERTLRDELATCKSKMEQSKMELRNFYQDQVEMVVREKLREFQVQLEKAETSLQEELQNRELTVARSAAMHIQQIQEKHGMEIHLIEEKHKEEVKLYNLQLSKMRQQIDTLQSKFQQQQERKSHIAKQLHKVMEAQWLEALKIINSKSPIIPQERSTTTIDQLNSLKSKSYNNVEEILHGEEPHPFEAEKNLASPKDYDDLNLSATTPLTSRPQKTRQQLDQEMQKYIQMV
uniref:Centrobin n=1 Tax=Photinus pyralis TaxID=7054 RepID=A0A1Y1LAT1_PHOPY